jgi:CHAD domain-containing protein
LLTAKSLETSLRSQLEAVNKSVDSFLTGPIPPPEGSVHKLRTAIRRVRTTYAILPKSERRKALSSYIKASGEAIKSTNAVRDIDVVRSIAARSRSKESLASSESGRALVKERINRLSACMRKVAALNVAEEPIISLKISDKSAQKRYKKKVGQLERKIGEIRPTVLKDEKKQDELHELRIAYRKLRYILQLDPSPSGKAKKTIKLLREWQTVLGAIHDSDITLEFLRKVHVPGLRSESIIGAEEKVRHKNYVAFVKSCKNSKL